MTVGNNRWKRFHQDDEQETKGARKEAGGLSPAPFFGQYAGGIEPVASMAA